MRWLTAGLAALLLLAQAGLWFGKSSMPYTMKLRGQLAEQQVANDGARARNQRVLAEVNDLKEGQEMVEEKARSELGMLRPDEIYVQVTRAKP